MLSWEQSVPNSLKIKYCLIVAVARELKPAGLHYISKSRPMSHLKCASQPSVTFSEILIVIPAFTDAQWWSLAG